MVAVKSENVYSARVAIILYFFCCLKNILGIAKKMYSFMRIFEFSS